MKTHPALAVAAAIVICAGAAGTVCLAQVPSLFTGNQATQGQASYNHNCLTCHGPHLDDGDQGGAPLRGSYFRNHWGGGNVAALFAFMKSAMPPDNPGSLTDRDYADILAFILQANGYAPGANALPTDPQAQEKLKLGTEGGT